MLPLLRRGAYLGRVAWELLRGRQPPLIAGLSVTDVCNLACAHCWRSNTGQGHASYEQVRRALRQLFGLGARYLYIQGGEPFTWRDGDRRLDDVVSEARRVGFFHVAVCTNGTLPLAARPDSFSISLEGDALAHDRIRCGSFARVLAQIEASPHPNLFANATFNRLNQGALLPLAELVRANPRLRGVLVNFHIPYPGVESLALRQDERAELVRQARALKHLGYPILNTWGGLEALERNDWARPLDLSVVSDCRSIYSCCRARGDERVCRACGYAGWAELSRVLARDWRSALEVLSMLHFGIRR